jgi:TPR repeat protein
MNGRPDERTAAVGARRLARTIQAAERGDGRAACALGDRYRDGRGVRYSPRLAYHWYSRSALAGDPNGQNNLGACYEHAFGCRQSFPKAVEWYRRAAAQECATAMLNLGSCYRFGHGVPMDRSEALRQFRLALDHGEERALEELRRLGEPVTSITNPAEVDA